MYVSILRNEMRKAHLLFTLLTTLFRKQASKNLLVMSQVNFIDDLYYWKNKKVLSEKNNN